MPETASVDDLLDANAPAQQGANVDDLLNQNAPQSSGQSPVHDALLGASGPFGIGSFGTGAKVLDAFGQGFKNAWGYTPIGQNDPEIEETLHKAGLLPALDENAKSFAEAFNRGVVRMAILPLTHALQGAANTVVSGFAGAQEAVHAGVEDVTGSGKLASDVAGSLESEGAIGHLHTPDIPRARALRVIGEGESGWKGAVDPTPETEAAQAEVQASVLPKDADEPVSPQPGVPAADSAPPPAPDIHQIARQLAPDTFQQYDDLTNKQATYRRWIDDLKETQADNLGPQHEAELQPLLDQQSEMQDRFAQPGFRPTKAQQGRLDALSDQIDDIRDRQQDELSQDTPDIQRVRAALQKNDYAMRDLAPQVSDAYREAQQRMPQEAEPAVEPETAPTDPQSETEQPAQAVPVVAQEAASEQSTPAATPSPKSEPINIADDVLRKLITAGRPTEEAQATAAVIASHYDARASRLGTDAPTLYRDEAPGVRGATVGGRGGAAAGKATIRNGRKMVTLFDKADASTFMHESGHIWLEDLMKDDADPRADATVKQDAETVRNWLGVDKAEDIKTRHHEKFARGFEQYLMEGRAPTKALAGVFEKFKNWLTDIYGSLSKLGSPINDSIRDVFDRLVSHETDRSAIGPEREGNELAAHHEALVDQTPPEQAHEVADRIIAERDSELSRKAPEILDELNAGRDTSPAEPTGSDGGTGGAGAEPPANAGSDGNGAERQLEPADAGGGAGRGAVNEGGGQTAPEGTGARAEPRSIGANTESGLVKNNENGQRGPNTDLPYDGGPLVDKAGNFRLELVDWPEDVKAAIRESAARQEDALITRRRGVMSDAETFRLADEEGIDPAELNRKAIGDAFNDREILVAGKFLAQTGAEVRRLATLASTGNEAAAMDFMKASAQLDMALATINQAEAEAGRSLRIIQQINKFTGFKEAKSIAGVLSEISEGKDLFQIQNMAKKIASLQTPRQISKLTRDLQRPGLFDWIQSAYTNALVSNPKTHATYTVAGDLLALQRAGLEGGLAAGVGRVRAALGADVRDTIPLATVRAQLFGFMRGQARGAIAFGRSVKAGDIVLPAEVMAHPELPYSTGQAIGQHSAIPNPKIGGVTLPIGHFLEGPSARMVSPLHSFNWTTFYTQSIARQAAEMAWKEGASMSVWDRSGRIAQLMDSPTQDMIKTAAIEASNGSLMTKPDWGTFSQRMSHLMNWGISFPDVPLPGGHALPLGTLRPAKFIEPFVQVSANIFKAAYGKALPFALFNEDVRNDLMFRNGGQAFDRTAGKILASTTILAASGWLASKELLNPSAPDDPKERAAWIRIHGMSHGLRIGNMTYDVLRLGPIGMQMATGANLWHAIDSMDKDDALSAVSKVGLAFAKDLLDESSMDGFSNASRAVEDEKYGATWARNYLSNFFPYSQGLSGIARSVDPNMRVTRTLYDEIKSKIPLWSETLVPQVDVWGQPVPNKTWMGTYSQAVSQDPVDRILVASGAFPGQPDRTIRGVKLTDQQYHDYCQLAGQRSKMELNAIVKNPGFVALPDGQKQRIVTKIVDRARDAAQTVVMGQNWSIINQAVQNKQSLLTVGKPH